jgi:hypothetical protein
MKKLILVLSYLLAVTLVPAQEITVAGKIVNYVMISALEIYNMDNSSGGKDKLIINQLHLDSKFEKLIGKQYKKEKVYDEVALEMEMNQNRKTLSEITLPFKQRITIPGLELMLPENKRGLVEFKLTTPQYHIVLENGKEIYVGMTADQLSAIFPISWADRHTLTYDNGKFGVGILVAYERNGEIIPGDDALGLDIDKITMKVEVIRFHVRD